MKLTATPCLQECARVIAQARQRGKHLCPRSASIGSPQQDYEATYWGTLAELTLYHAIEQIGGQPRYVLLAPHSVTEPDMTLRNCTFEIKCSPPNKAILCLSKRQHKDPRRRCDFYLPVLFIAPDAMRVGCPIVHEDIYFWHSGEGHEDYWWIRRRELRLLDTLQPLLKGNTR